MHNIAPVFELLTLMAVGTIIANALLHPEGVKALFEGANNLYKTGLAGELGKVA